MTSGYLYPSKKGKNVNQIALSNIFIGAERREGNEQVSLILWISVMRNEIYFSLKKVDAEVSHLPKKNTVRGKR